MATDIPRFDPVPDGSGVADHAGIPAFTGFATHAIRGKSGRYSRLAALAAYSTYRYRATIFSGVGFAAGTALTIYSVIAGR
jgi:hypothetical protein